MGLARIEPRYTTVLKDYRDHADGQQRWQNEITAYTQLGWAAPKLLCSNPYWLEMERCTPILDLTRDQSTKYRQPLRDLLQAIHDAGYWHRDISLVNVVIHPARGPLLIDWENLTPATGSISYDLYGARLAGVEPAWDAPGGNGVWWGGPWDTCPGLYWKQPTGGS